MASFVSIVVTVRNSVGSGLRATQSAFARAFANIRIRWNRMLNSFISRGGFGPLLGRLGRFGSMAGSVFAQNFSNVAQSGLRAFQNLPIWGQLAIGLAPAIAGALTSGILLAVGGGVLALGIAAAAKSPAVKSAFDSFKDTAKTAFKDLGGPLQAPLVRALSAFGAEAVKIAPTINNMVAMVAPHLDGLVLGLTKMVDNIMPGFSKAFEASLPFLDKLGEKLPSIGTAISQFFELIADSGPEAMHVFTFLIDALNVIIVVLGGTISFAAKYYSTMIGFWKGVGDVAVSAWHAIVDAFNGAKSAIISAFSSLTSAILGFVGTIINAAAKAFGWIPGIGPKLQQAAADFNAFKNQVNAALAAIDKHVVITIERKFIGGTLGGSGGYRGFSHGGVAGAASGGSRNRLVMTGEHGRELVDFNAGRVYNNNQTERMMAGAGGGAVAVHVTVAADPGSAKDSLVQMALKLIRDGDLRLRVQGNRVVAA